MRIIPTAALLFAAALLNACSFESDATYQLTVESNDPATVEATNQILLARFHRVLPSFFSTVESEVSGSNLAYTFRRGAPENSTITYLCRSVGAFSITLAEDESGEIWATDLDIERASVGADDSGAIILIQLSEAAGERMISLTSQNLGKVAIAMMDDEILVEATIRGVFASRFQVTAPPNVNPEAVAAILEAGSLPVPVKLNESQDGA